MSLASVSVERPVATTMGLAFLVVMGFFAYVRVPIDLFPRVEIPIITILTVYPGASPEEIESLISDPIEEAVSSISGIEKLTSNSLEGVSQVVIEFDVAKDQDVAAQDVREKLDLILADLPDDAERPKILKLDINATAVVEVAVYGERSVGWLTEYVRDNVKDEFTKISGVADVDVVGGRAREIQILIDEKRMSAMGVSMVGLAQTLAAKSVEIPGGRIIRGDREWTVRVAGKFTDVEQIRDLDVPTPSGRVIKLRELAEVRDTFEEERQRASFNGLPAVLLAIKKRSDANTVAVAAAVRTQMVAMEGHLAEGVRIGLVKDRSTFIQSSLDEVTSNIVIGILLTGAILYMFLHSGRATFIAALAMPASIVGTFILIYFAGFTLNMLTLMALSITVGILVNNAIVVLECIKRRVEAGEDPVSAAVTGTDEILVAVSGATLTNVVVFVPIAFMGGVVGQFFKSFGLTASFATLVSLLFSFTLVPLLASKLIHHSSDDDASSGRGFAGWFDGRYRALESEYGADLPWILHHPTTILASSLVLLVLAFMLAPSLGFEFMAETDQGEFIVKLRRPAGSSLEATAGVARQIEDIIRRRVPELERLATKVGKIDAVIGASEGVELGQVTAYVGDKTSRARSARTILDSLRGDLAGLTNVVVSLEVPGTIGSEGPPLQVEVVGLNLDRVVEESAKVLAVVRSAEGAADVDTTWLAGRPELKVVPDRVRCEQAGISMGYLAQSVRGRFAGLTPVKYREGSNEYDVRILLEQGQRREPDSLASLEFVGPDGKKRPITDLASVTKAVGPSRIVRKERKKAVIVSGYVKGKSFGEVLQTVQAGVRALNLPPDVTVRYMGQAERIGDTFSELGQAFLLAVILTYLLLAGLIESYVHPVIILASLPLSFIGIIPALYICGMHIAMFALMAVVMLVGIVVNNGILIIENVTALRAAGKDLEEAVVQGSPERLRPIIMTTLAAALAMIPLALGQGQGGEMRAPMAVVSIGGLLVSAVLSLVIIPMLYFQWERLKLGRSRGAGTAAVILVAALALAVPAGPTLAADETAVASELSYAGLDPGLADRRPQVGEGAVGLDEAVARARSDNRLLAAALRKVRGARQGVRVADAARLGELKAQVSRIKYHESFVALVGADAATSQSLVYDLPLYAGGALASGERSARLGLEVAQEEAREATQTVVEGVVEAYLGLVKTQWLVVLGQEYVRQMELQLELVQARIEAGAAMASDRLRVEVALQDARVRLLQFENARDRAQGGLNLAMGAPIDDAVEAQEPTVMTPLDEALEEGYARAAGDRPALRILDAAVKLAREDLVRARAARRPGVGLNVTYGDSSALFASDVNSTQVVLAAELPLFKGGALRADVERAREGLAEQEERTEFARRAVFLEVKQAWLDVGEAWRRIGVTRKALASAVENARVTGERYRAGAAIVLELVDAQIMLLGTRTSVLQALMDYGTALARYHLACGDVERFFGRHSRS